MGQGGNFILESCQGFGLKGVSGKGIPIRDSTWEKGKLDILCSSYIVLVGYGYHFYGV